MSENNVSTVVKTPSKFTSRYNQLLVGAAASVPLFAMAEVDMTAATAVLVSATAAVGALGAAKVAPAALTWVWSLVTGMAKRG